MCKYRPLKAEVKENIIKVFFLYGFYTFSVYYTIYSILSLPAPTPYSVHYISLVFLIFWS